MKILFWLFLITVVYIIYKKHFVNYEDKITSDKDIPIEKRPFVFDIQSELVLYKVLLETFSDKYFVMPQIGYERLIKVKAGEDRYFRNFFDKKRADFVLCDIERGVAKLVIELDGPSHGSQQKIDRDEKVDQMMEAIKLPILHLTTNNFDKEYLRQEVNKKISEYL